MSFDYREALRPLQGPTLYGPMLFTARALYVELGNICVKNYGQLPVNFTAEDYLTMVRQRGWVRENQHGWIVDIDSAPTIRDDSPRRWKMSESGRTIFGCYFPGSNLNATSEGVRFSGAPILWIESVIGASAKESLEWLDPVDDLPQVKR